MQENNIDGLGHSGGEGRLLFNRLTTTTVSCTATAWAAADGNVCGSVSLNGSHATFKLFPGMVAATSECEIWCDGPQMRPLGFHIVSFVMT